MPQYRPLLPKQRQVQKRLDTESMMHPRAELRGRRYIETLRHHCWCLAQRPEGRRHDV